ncbi:MAG: hypothetical protein KAT46_04995 [Deltaproteobacteria bacterium]|nr:hypothetical protein [Deltaproteobacteria bacterium]
MRFKFFFSVFLFMVLTLPSCSISNGEVGENTSAWVNGGEMLTPRMAPAYVAVGDTFYIIGGSNDKGYISEVEWTRIRADGGFTGWKKSRSLNTPRGYSAGVYYNHYIYVLGGAYGKYGQELLNTVERVKVNRDGSLGKWVLEKEKLFSARRGTTAYVRGGYIYAIGGYNGEFLDTVERAKINADGTLGSWSLESIMEHRRYIHSSVGSGCMLYVMGGHHKSSGGATEKVEYAEILQDATLGQWQESPSINHPRYGAVAVRVDKQVYLIGGYDGKALSFVEAAGIKDDRGLGEWKNFPSLKIPRDAPAVLVHDDYIYVLGGVDDKGKYQSSVEVARVGEKGEFVAWKE